MERDRWIDPPAAIDLGLISKVVTGRKELDTLLQRSH
jgi:ATP-dependent protease ClpP protease subunit